MFPQKGVLLLVIGIGLVRKLFLFLLRPASLWTRFLILGDPSGFQGWRFSQSCNTGNISPKR